MELAATIKRGTIRPHLGQDFQAIGFNVMVGSMWSIGQVMSASLGAKIPGNSVFSPDSGADETVKLETNSSFSFEANARASRFPRNFLAPSQDFSFRYVDFNKISSYLCVQILFVTLA
ncbi:hypothetical protein HAX54_027895 [Datura stramonium]|uniref:Uncharacterized protein n=1 Tax=Datura stramonium TaxID=4076 RepID=A0ABS8V3F7_DATST|nr:hypothetical protein [Datura stramonium]